MIILCACHWLNLLWKTFRRKTKMASRKSTSWCASCVTCYWVLSCENWPTCGRNYESHAMELKVWDAGTISAAEVIFIATQLLGCWPAISVSDGKSKRLFDIEEAESFRIDTEEVTGGPYNFKWLPGHSRRGDRRVSIYFELTCEEFGYCALPRFWIQSCESIEE